MIKYLTIACLIASVGFAFSINASTFPGSTGYSTEKAPGTIVWYENTHSQGKIKFMTSNDRVVGVISEIPHYPQPNDYTCGAANLAMAKAWFQFVKTGSMPRKPDIMEIYNAANNDGNRGLTTSELKNAIRPIVDLPHREYGWDTVDKAIQHYVRETHLVDEYQTAPGIVYGNVPYGTAGGHYYSMAGAVYCNGNCNDDYNGAYFFDSVFDSPAYATVYKPKRKAYPEGLAGDLYWELSVFIWEVGSGPGNLAISPGRFMTTDALEDYWEPTGASLPWNRKHYYLALTDFNR